MDYNKCVTLVGVLIKEEAVRGVAAWRYVGLLCCFSQFCCETEIAVTNDL